jgi:hypothetical protein
LSQSWRIESTGNISGGNQVLLALVRSAQSAWDITCDFME